MHELSIAMDIVELAIDYAGKENAGQVKELEIEVGDFSGVVIDALEFALEEAVRDTICEDALWKIIRVHGSVRCRDCSYIFEPESLFEPCPACGEFGMELMSGKELRLKSIVVD